MRLLLPVLVLAAPLAAQTLLSAQPIDVHSVPALGAKAVCAAAGDVDGDGDDDLAVAEGNDVVVYHQQAGQFTRSLVLSDVQSSPQTVAVADFDHDGHSDLLFGPYGTLSQPSLRIWWGDGTGLFQFAPTTSIVLSTYFNKMRVVVGDVDHDGDVDIVAACPSNGYPYSCMLLRNNGARTFAEAPVAQFPRLDSGDCRAHLVDLDDDTFDDLVIVSRTARSRVYWNNAGNFAEATLAQFPALQRSLRGFAAADIDGDGARDLVFGGDVDAGVVFRRIAPRQFVQLAGAQPLPSRTVALHAVDVDGDHLDDLFVFRTERGQLRRSDGLGGFPLVETFGGCDGTQWVAPADLDGDGDQDLLCIGRSNLTTGTLPPATVSASFAVGGGRLEHLGGVRLSTSTADVLPWTGDIDGDGLTDVAPYVTEPSGTSYLQFASCDGRGTFGHEYAPRPLPSLERGFFGDLDGDRRAEYVVPGTTTGYFANLQGQLAATMTPIPIPWTAQAGTVLDIDGDLDPELVLLERWGAVIYVHVLENQGGTWVDRTAQRVNAPTIGYAIASSLRAVAADLDGDLASDLVVGSDTHTMVLRNQGGVLTFVPGAVPYSPGGDYQGTCVDLDGDGDLDLAWGRRVYLNVGQCLFTDHSQGVPAVSYSDTLGRASDVDDDGDVDLLGQGMVLWNDGHANFTVASNVTPVVATNGNEKVWVDSDLDGDVDMIGVVGLNGRVTHYTNMLRQFWFSSPARLGGTLDFRYHAQPGQNALPVLVWFACSFARTAPIFHDDYGWQFVDESALIALGPYALPATGGDVLHAEPLPNVPALRGVYLCAQPIELRGTRWRLGNFVETWIGR